MYLVWAKFVCMSKLQMEEWVSYVAATVAQHRATSATSWMSPYSGVGGQAPRLYEHCCWFGAIELGEDQPCEQK